MCFYGIFRLGGFWVETYLKSKCMGAVTQLGAKFWVENNQPWLQPGFELSQYTALHFKRFADTTTIIIIITKTSIMITITTTTINTITTIAIIITTTIIITIIMSQSIAALLWQLQIVISEPLASCSRLLPLTSCLLQAPHAEPFLSRFVFASIFGQFENEKTKSPLPAIEERILVQLC